MQKILNDLDLLARLVAIDSTSAITNLPIAEFLCEYLERQGVRIDRNLSEKKDKVNLVVRMGPEIGKDRRGLVLSAHMDTVPAGRGWTSEPFSLTDRGDRLFGRGTADMKGFLALAVNAFARTDPDGLDAPLALLLTYDEELGLLGAKRFAETWPETDPLPKNTVVGEPTSLQVVRMHKGHTQLRVTVHGVNAHSGYPHRGVNAIEPAGRVINALSGLRRELEKEPPVQKEYYPETPFVTLNLGTITGGMAVNVVPDRCTVELGLRTLPGVESAPYVERVRKTVEEAIQESRFDFELINNAPSMLLGEKAPIHQTLCEWTGQKETVGVSYGTDAGWFQTLGMESVVFGPGSIEVAHKPDEFIPKKEFQEGCRYIERLIERFCRA